MRRLTKILVVAIIAILVLALFVSNIGYYAKADDYNSDDDAYDFVDTDDDEIPNTEDDDIDGDGQDNYADADDDGDDVPDDEDEDPIIPSEDDNNNDVPDVLEPLAVVKITDIAMQFAVVADVYGNAWFVGDYVSTPVIDVTPYSGTADVVYDWHQTVPQLFLASGEVNVNWTIQIFIYSDFRSTEYVYNLTRPDNSIAEMDRFYADYNHNGETTVTYYKDIIGVEWVAGAAKLNDVKIDSLPDDAWGTAKCDSTGNCYLWEAGKYIVRGYLIGSVDDDSIRSNLYSLPELSFTVVL